MLRRWYRNIRWLLNNPPTRIVEGDIFKCDYCGEQGEWRCREVVAFCFACFKKALDKALKEE